MKMIIKLLLLSAIILASVPQSANAGADRVIVDNTMARPPLSFLIFILRPPQIYWIPRFL